MAPTYTERREFSALAQAAGIDAERLKAAIGDPSKFFDHITLEELKQLQDACVGIAEIGRELTKVFDAYISYAKGFLEAHRLMREEQQPEPAPEN